MKRFDKRWLWLLLLIPVLLAASFVVWANNAPSPMPEAVAALQSDAQVQVETQPWLVFKPSSGQPTTGLIFYPGGKVDPRSYAPAAHALAAQGYLVVIPPMPLNLAVFAPGKAAEVMAAYPDIQNWAVGGHSLGGSMAANFARKHPELVKGLVFWASYPASSDNLSKENLKVASVYGTQDGLATKDKIDASRPLLPAGTQWVAIEGGNHGQFGWYGSQGGDNAASISREVQQQQAIAATLALLQEISK